MTEPVEGELLPAIRRSAEPHELTHRHAVCHRAVRESLPPWVALCGHIVRSLAETRRQDLPKCPRCLAASTEHAQRCDCWKLHPNLRLPR